jgi:hypothetical protein
LSTKGITCNIMIISGKRHRQRMTYEVRKFVW